jgi:hypothetical protein
MALLNEGSTLVEPEKAFGRNLRQLPGSPIRCPLS